MSVDKDRVKDIALKHALINAVKFNGKASMNAVISKVFAEDPSLRPMAKEVAQIVKEVIDYVNSLSIDEQRNLLMSKWPEALGERKVETYKKGIEDLPPLPNDSKYEVITLRFAPNPDFVLHLGSARPAIINYAYKLKYEGLGKKAKFILRFEDTDPRTKRPLPEAYDAIKEDLRWLGIRWDEEYIQSDRLGIYYEIARKILEKGGAYVAAKDSGCTPDDWKKSKVTGKPCKNRDADPSVNLELFDRMLEGHYKEGEAVMVIKTDLQHPDPSVRDWVAMRIIDTTKYPHPRVGSKYIVWPTYNFSVSVDDHLMGITHILRAQEHSVNTIKQSFIYVHMGWEQPEAIHFGRLKIVGMTLSKTKLKALGIKWDDIRLPTLAGLRNRGIQPEAIWNIMLQVGVKPTDATISSANLFAENRKIIEPKANRYMAVIDPIKVIIEGVTEELTAKLPMHPSYPERGFRTLTLKPINNEITVFISKSDYDKAGPGSVIRLMELANIEVMSKGSDSLTARIHSRDLESARRVNAPIIQWVPPNGLPMRVVRPEDLKLVEDVGLAEPGVEQVSNGEIIQFMRYGFVKKVERDRFIYVHD
ncbi:glutamate--tRNA ligase [Vulcanisaeta distributa]|uniref:Glutamate--tRNA ligase n=1 Tax=Vulcanisaeta distributa (strain DSM 14429 / JCM 11212 / NBRC 100878 / IC-017) TaxID=572478 RepID=E1QS27_VULDI|nr:glutamate--tRNA ligase [Vulcanisaeta distributa]ADN51859.1 glutamyl-tRNA synthetase [Vulcanisaeta distributa DSM 14429]